MTIQLLPGRAWDSCGPDLIDQLSDSFRRLVPHLDGAGRVVQAHALDLPFYREHRLVEADFSGIPRLSRGYFLFGRGEVIWLNGASTPIHEVNLRESLALHDDQLLDYLRFFLAFLHGVDTPFQLIEHPEQIALDEGSDVDLESVRARVSPPAPQPAGEDGMPRIGASVAYGGMLFSVVFVMRPNGLIEMVDDQEVAKLDGLTVPQGFQLADLPPPGAEADQELPERNDDEEVSPPTPPAPGPKVSNTPVLTDREVTAIVVRVLLAEAAAAAMGHRLLRRFNTSAGAGDSLRTLARFVIEFTPVVIIESEIPFIEEIAARLLDPDCKTFTPSDTTRAVAITNDDATCSFSKTIFCDRLYLASFHAYRRLADAEWTAHRLSISQGTVLIGCQRQQDVPEPLRRVTDLVISLPRIDRDTFPEIFRQVFGEPPPDAWLQGDTAWVRYLLHADFHAPRRLGLTPEEALTYLEERCRARISEVSVQDGPGLDELHGMAEARQIAEDLIADIAAACRGEVGWHEVDRGLLLVGPPGVGKTTLARAMARACNVRFMTASATQWQANGSLDVHLRAIRETFAEARRYAPCMLFIDEIDSIGSRETLSGHNAQYQSEVINGVLEQIQGLDPREPVIIIGATNLADRVDPALRRAGRLDQVIRIPLPNVAALEQIFAFYLERHRVSQGVTDDVDTKALAGLAFGLTGADVEFFVRGAARRARKAARSIGQADLVAEVTRRPRHGEAARRLDPQDMRRVAVHEAGHAIAMLHDGRGGGRINLVSIVPRTDGSLGFVARMPPESALETRRGVLDQLRTVLAGRAAEELVYGSEDISLGAGGGQASDLAVATRIATRLVCRSGLAESGALHWSEEPSPEQGAEVERLLQSAYRSALDLLSGRREALERLSAALLEHQELTGEQVRATVLGPER